ncbi:MAG: RtcB family protein [Desulfocapsaceae bacterium]|nr:RtcB family protein [Desulfocapsaceae bacterium]
MIRTITSEKKPIKLWLDDIEEGALAQAKNLANLPFTFRHVAIMADAHLGYGMPIGGVLATEDVIIPNAVGADIGCGMCAVRTSLDRILPEDLKTIMRRIRGEIPVGFKHHSRPQDQSLMPLAPADKPSSGLPMVEREYENGLRQLGTLGGGNHFIEIQRGDDGHIWIMIHSGSRNIGFRVANHYNRLAIDLNARHKSAVPSAWQLAHLPLSSETGRQYLAEMQFCVEFALANRQLMMERIQDIFASGYPFATFADPVNIAHNYARLEHHFGREVLVHRKGATSARLGETGIIPGSQGTRSCIVRGLGNADSFTSCSHGAGRIMGRKQAQRQLDLQAEIRRLDAQGVIHGIRGRKDLDEAAGAYKDIGKVLEAQTDLIEVLVNLQPLAVIKG